MENSLKHLIEIIKTGKREQVKKAQKLIEKFWRNVYIHERVKGAEDFSIFRDEIKKFDIIKDIDHQIYFIGVLKWPFLAIGEKYFEDWAEFILTYIQHPSGHIRQAILHAAGWLTMMDIVIDLKIDGSKKLSTAEKQRIRKNKRRFCHFTYNVEYLLGKYDEPRFSRYKYVSSMPPSVYKSLQKLIVEVLLCNKYYKKIYTDFLINLNSAPPRLDEKEKHAKSREHEYRRVDDDFKMPIWMDCTWRRIPCGKNECKICGQVNKNRQKHIRRGEDPDAIESILEDVGDTFDQTLTMVKKDAKRMGIDTDVVDDYDGPPRPDAFPLCKKLGKWRASIFKIAKEEYQSRTGESLWLNTEEASNLFWYVNTLSAKTYRQLCNRWHIETDDDAYGNFDYEYTNYVLKECITILKKSLKDLSFLAPAKTGELISALAELANLEKEILKI